MVLLTMFLILLVTGAFMACFAVNYIQKVILPQAPLDVSAITLDQTSVIYYTDAATGQAVELQTLYQEENRVWVEFEEIPEDLINATAAIEDKRFWEHDGVDWKRTAYGVLSMFTGRDIQGGSTLTQQLIKNLTQKDEVTVKRKILEIFRALEVEKQLENEEGSKQAGKERIIHLYLNTIFLGEQCYGVGTAAQVYFGKDVSELTLAECASLIGITNNPSKYDPYLSTKIENPDTGEMWTTKQWNKYRQELILYQMLDQGYITQEEYDEAVAQELVFQRGETSGDDDSSSGYSWFVDAVINSVLEDLIEEKGYSEENAKQILYRGGYKIYTTYDPTVQAVVDEVYENQENLNFTSSSGQQLQSAITIVDNETGAVVALSGGIGEKKGSRTYVRATQAHRQPGSSIKPLSVYAPALDLGLVTPNSVVADTPYGIIDGSIWPAESYGYYKGNMTIRAAVEVSSNAVAVKVLEQVTPDYAYDFMVNKLGFSTESIIAAQTASNGKIQTDIGLAQLGLGGLTNGATTEEMAAAFAIFPRGGDYIEPYLYTKVLDSNDQVVLENTSESEKVIKDSTAYYMNSMLRDVVTSGTGTAANFSGMTIAGKTGTTTSKKDSWFVGYSGYYTAAVWVGYDTPERITASGNQAAKLWKLVMQPIHEGLENKSFPQNVETVTASYCLDCGKLATDNCAQDIRGSRAATGTYVKGDVPTDYCDCHTDPVAVCTESPIVDSEGNPTGLYHLAGEFCPDDSVVSVTLLVDNRDLLGGAYTASDSAYFYSWVAAQGTCDVHTTESEEPDGGEDLPIDVPLPPVDGSETDEPTTSPDPEPSTSPEPSASPEPSDGGHDPDAEEGGGDWYDEILLPPGVEDPAA